MVHFTEINQTPPPYSMLQDIGREARPKLATTNCPKYLQTTLIMGWGGLVSEFMWGIVGVQYVWNTSRKFRKPNQRKRRHKDRKVQNSVQKPFRDPVEEKEIVEFNRRILRRLNILRHIGLSQGRVHYFWLQLEFFIPPLFDGVLYKKNFFCRK